MSELAKLDRIHQALAEVTTVEAAKEIHDQAAAMRVYSNTLKDRNQCAKVVVIAARLVGEMLRETVSQGRPSKTSHNGRFLPPDISYSQSHRFQKIAAVPEEKIHDHMAALEAQEGGEITINGVLRLANSLRRDEKAAGLETSPLPVGIFRVIYADPPWSYGNSGVIGADSDHYGRAKRHYPTMPTKEICEMEVMERAADNSVLFLWTTSPLLEESFSIINAWGFKYKSSFVWHKLRHNFAHYNSMRHEFLLIATRGSCTPDTKELIPSVVEIDRGEHSGKPDQFREMIDLLYVPPKTGSDRLELFVRGDLPEHWTAWGNEAGK